MRAPRNDCPYSLCYDAYEPRLTSVDLGTIVVDIIDARARRLVWRGWARQPLDQIINDPPRVREVLSKAVVKMMDSLPPAAAREPRSLNAPWP